MRRNYGVGGVKSRSRSAGPVSRASRARLNNATNRFMGMSRSRGSNYVGRQSNVRQVVGNLAKKGMDTDVSIPAGSVIDTTTTNASSFVLNLVQQGAGSWNRVGRKIIPKSLRIKGTLVFTLTPLGPGGAQAGNSMRQVVVWDKQPSGGAVPTFDTIFGITAQDGTESCPDITCPPRYDTMDRFQVLSDTMICADDAIANSFGTAPNLQVTKELDTYIPLKVGETVFSGQSAPMTIADINSGALYVFYRARNNLASTNVTIDAVARLRYLN